MSQETCFLWTVHSMGESRIYPRKRRQLPVLLAVLMRRWQLRLRIDTSDWCVSRRHKLDKVHSRGQARQTISNTHTDINKKIFEQELGIKRYSLSTSWQGFVSQAPINIHSRYRYRPRLHSFFTQRKDPDKGRYWLVVSNTLLPQIGRLTDSASCTVCSRHRLNLSPIDSRKEPKSNKQFN